jgi:hypothetical protein
LDSIPKKYSDGWGASVDELGLQETIVYLSLLVGGIPTPLKNMSSSMGRMTSLFYYEKQSIHV